MSAVPVRKTYKLYVGGAFPRSESGRTYEAEGQNVARASRKDARDAVRGGAEAQPGWAGATAYNRGQVLYRVAEMMEARAAELAAACSGKPEVERRDRPRGLVRGLGGQARAGARRLEPGRRAVLQLHRARSRPASSRSSRPTSRRSAASSRGSRRRSSAATPPSSIASETHPRRGDRARRGDRHLGRPGRRRQHPHRLPRRARADPRRAHGRQRDRPHRRRTGSRPSSSGSPPTTSSASSTARADDQSPWAIASFLELKTVWHPIGQ